MLGRMPRIQQSPEGSPIRAIPSSVEFIQARHEVSRRDLRLQSRPSQPIPIKKCRLSPQELEDEATSADSAYHYDWATWRMYDRITTARRLRSVTRSDRCAIQQHDPVLMAQDYHTFAQGQVHRSDDIHRSRQLSVDEEDASDGVFDLDGM